MPLPLAMMIPFMGAQSAVMAKQFGENFQYGKRRISAMSNEEFNKLTPGILSQRTADELKDMIPSMKQSIVDMHEFQAFVVQEFIQMMKDALAAGLGEVIDLVGERLTGANDPIIALIEFFKSFGTIPSAEARRGAPPQTSLGIDLGDLVPDKKAKFVKEIPVVRTAAQINVAQLASAKKLTFSAAEKHWFSELLTWSQAITRGRPGKQAVLVGSAAKSAAFARARDLARYNANVKLWRRKVDTAKGWIRTNSSMKRYAQWQIVNR